MERHFCEVVPVYVRPQSMVDEQACFGVIVRCPSANFYGYRLARGDEAAIVRIASFFPRYGRAGLEQAMTWAAQDIEYTFDRERNKGDKGAFANLIRPRENVVRYGAPQAVFSADPAAELDDLYRRSVQEK